MNFLLCDIETAPMQSFHWDPRVDYIPHDFNTQPTTLLCASWKLDDSGVKNTSIHHFNKRLTHRSVRNDKQVVKRLHSLLMEAAEENWVIVAQNGDRFDLPKIKSRCLYYDLPPIPKLVTVDTLKQARKLGFDYKRLDYLDKYLHGHDAGKVETRGWLMWRDIVEPHSSHDKRLQAIREMVHYCDGDILALERVFNTLRPHMDQFPNMNLWQGTTTCCPQCGSDRIIYRSKPCMAKTQMYRRMSCKDCGKWFQETGAMRGEDGRVIKANVK